MEHQQQKRQHLRDELHNVSGGGLAQALQQRVVAVQGVHLREVRVAHADYYDTHGLLGCGHQGCLRQRRIAVRNWRYSKRKHRQSTTVPSNDCTERAVYTVGPYTTHHTVSCIIELCIVYITIYTLVASISLMVPSVRISRIV